MSGLPLVGNVFAFNKDHAALIRRGYRTYGPVFGFRLGPQPVAALIGPDLLMRYVQEDLEVGDYVEPKDWLVMVMAGVAHRLPTVFRDPEQFDPFRYAPGRDGMGAVRPSPICVRYRRKRAFWIAAARRRFSIGCEMNLALPRMDCEMNFALPLVGCEM